MNEKSCLSVGDASNGFTRIMSILSEFVDFLQAYFN